MRLGDSRGKNRYEVLSLMGDGTFGRCLKCRPRIGGQDIAVKVIRDVDRYVESAKIETAILRDICHADPGGSSRCVHLLDDFMHRGKWYCLAFEPLSSSLYDYLKGNDYRGFWMTDIQAIAADILTGLDFCRGLQLTHTDLKTENVLFSVEDFAYTAFPRESTRKSRPYKRPGCASVKLIDFGNATYAKEHHTRIINTRQYRGPEVILGSRSNRVAWDEQSDMWSTACILAECFTGNLFFQCADEDLEHLKLMEVALGVFPPLMLKESSPQVVNEHFEINYGSSRMPMHTVRWGSHSQRSGGKAIRRQQTPSGLVEGRPEYRHFAELLEECFRYQPECRPTPARALCHPFFQCQFQD